MPSHVREFENTRAPGLAAINPLDLQLTAETRIDRRMPRLRNMLSRWALRQRKLQQRAAENAEAAEFQPTIRKLERRRVLSATFAGGVLDVNLTGGLTHTLRVDGADFHLDENNDTLVDAGEETGALATLELLKVSSTDSSGSFIWLDDFSAAFQTTQGAGVDTILIDDIATTDLNAKFNAKGDVTITSLTGALTLGNVVDVDEALAIDVVGTITDGSTFDLNVDGTATFDADGGMTLNDEATNSLVVDKLATFISNDGGGTKNDIKIGSTGTATLGSLDADGDDLTFEVDGGVVIEDIAATTLKITAAGTITDVDAVDKSSIQITDDADFIATDSITLGDTAGDDFDVTDEAYFETAAIKTISIGPGGAVDFGSLGLKGGEVTVQEDSAMHLDGVDVAKLTLTSTDLITQSGVDTGAGTGAVEVTGDTSLTLSATGSVELLRVSSAPAGTTNDGALVDNDLGGALALTGVDADFRLRNVSATGTFAIPATLSGDLEIWMTNQAISLTTDVAVTGDVNLLAGVDVDGTSKIVTITATGADVGDAASKLTVGGNATFIAADTVSFAETAGEKLTVTKTTTAVSLAGTAITLGTGGDFSTASLAFRSSTVDQLTKGAVIIETDGATELTNVVLPDPDNRTLSNQAGTLTLTVNGSLTDASDTDVEIGTTSSITTKAGSGGSISLADNAGDTLDIGGTSTFVSDDAITIAEAGTVDLGTLNLTATTKNATVFEDADMDLNTISVVSLDLDADGNITDATGATITVTGAANITANVNGGSAGSISLADNGTDTLDIDGAASFDADDAITIAEAGTVTLGDLSLKATTKNATVFEDEDMSLSTINVASLDLDADGDITDVAGATINVTGASNMTAHAKGASLGSISLADNGTDSIDMDGATSFTADDAITIAEAGTVKLGALSLAAASKNATVFEDEDMELATITVASLDLDADGNITDAAGATITVTGASNITANVNGGSVGSISLADNGTDTLDIDGTASFDADDAITIAEAGTVTLGDLSLKATTKTATVFEDEDMVLDTITVADLVLDADGDITDAATAVITVTGNSSMNANVNGGSKGLINLADGAGNTLKVTGSSYFEADDNITINAAGTVEFGSLGLKGLEAVITEDNATHLDGVDVDKLTLTSTNLITQSGSDTGAGTGVIDVAGDTSLTLSSATGSVELLRVSSAPPGTTNDGALVDNVIDGALTATGADASFRLRNTSATGTITALPTTLSGDLELWFTKQSITLPAATIAVTGDVNLLAGVDIDGSNKIVTITGAAADVFDGGSKLTVGGNATFIAADTVSFAETAGEKLIVTGRTAAVSLGGKAITLGTGGDFSTTSLAFRSSTVDQLTKGAVVIEADTATELTNVVLPDPDNRTLSNQADTLTLTVSGNLTDASGTDIEIGSTSSMTTKAGSGGSISLADNAGDTIDIGGTTTFTSDDSITIAEAGTVDLGTLNLTATTKNATVFEDADMDLDTITVASLDLDADGNITDAAGATITVTGVSNITANVNGGNVGSISLADNGTDTLDIDGTASFDADDAITIAEAGTVTLGDLSLKATTKTATVFEDEDMVLDTITVADLVLDADGDITDAATAVITVTGNSSMNANVNGGSKGLINLADGAGNTLKVTGSSYFEADDNITINAAGTVEFGSLGLKGLEAVITEDNATHLDGVDVDKLTLTSTNLITQSGSDTGAGTGVIDVAGDTSLTLSSATGSVELLRVSSAPPGTTNDGALVDNVIDGALTATGADASFRLRNTSATGTITALPTTLSGDLELWFTKQSITLPAATIAVTGDVNLLAGVDIDGSNKIVTITGAAADVFDGGSKLTVGGNATFIAADTVSFAETAGEKLIVTGRTAAVSLGGKAITLGTGGDFSTTSLAFRSSTVDQLTKGAVVIEADTATELTNVVMPAPDGRSLSNQADTLTLTVSGNLTDASGTDIEIGTTSSMTTKAGSGGSIRLADNAGDTLDIGGASTFVSDDAITIAEAGTVDLGTLNLTATTKNATVFEDADMELNTISVASLDLDADGNITDATGATITVTGASNITANVNGGSVGSISLADNATDTLDIDGAASFDADDAITIAEAGTVTLGDLSLKATTKNATVFEDEDMSLATINVASLDLDADGDITDVAGSSVTVTGASNLTAHANGGSLGSISLADNATDVIDIDGATSFTADDSITIAEAGSVKLGTLSLKATTKNATVFEDEDMELGTITVASLDLDADGNITDTAGATITVTGASNITANVNGGSVGSISLADNATDTLDIDGAASFDADDAITIAEAGTVTLGNLSLKATTKTATVFEDEDMVLDTITVEDLALDADGNITDVAGSSITVTGLANMTAHAAGGSLGSITLADNGTDAIDIDGATSFTADDAITIAEAGSVKLGTLSLDTSTNNATVFEDEDMELGTIGVASLDLDADGNITDAAGSSTTVSGVSNMTAHAAGGSLGSISLADNGGDAIDIDGASNFTADDAITIAEAGSVKLGDLSLKATTKNATVFEDEDMSLNTINVASLDLDADGNITDVASSSITVTGVSNMTAHAKGASVGSIDLADNGTDAIDIVGATSFTADDSITIAEAGSVKLGTLSLSATTKNATVFEDEDMELATITVASLDIDVDGNITDAAGSSVTVTGASNMTAHANGGSLGSISLADNGADAIDIDGATSFTADDAITVAEAGSVKLGTLNLATTKNATVFEDEDMELGAIATGSLDLDADGNITDIAGASITVTGVSNMTAHAAGGSLGSINLADNGADAIDIDGATSFTADDAISVAEAGSVKLGAISLTTATKNATVFEDEDMELSKISVASLDLDADGDITDAAGSSISVTGVSNMTAHAAGASTGSITLADTGADAIEIKGVTTFNADDAVSVGDDGDAGVDVKLGTITAEATNNVTIFEDQDTNLASVKAGSFNLDTDGNISDSAPAFINIVGSSAMVAHASGGSTGQINLGDELFVNGVDANKITIGGNASFTADDLILIAEDAAVSFGSLGLTATNDATVFEDNVDAVTGTVLTGVSVGSLTLDTDGDITDAIGTSISVGGASKMTARANGGNTGSITLANGAGDTISIIGHADFQGSDAITISETGTVGFGSLSLNTTNNATVFEDNDTLLTDVGVGSLVIDTDGDITDAASTDINVGTTSSMTAHANGGSKGSITLTDDDADNLNIAGDTTFIADEDLSLGDDGKTGQTDVKLGNTTLTIGNDATIFEDDDIKLATVTVGDALELRSPLHTIRNVDQATPDAIKATSATLEATTAHLDNVNFEKLSAATTANALVGVTAAENASATTSAEGTLAKFGSHVPAGEVTALTETFVYSDRYEGKYGLYIRDVDDGLEIVQDASLGLAAGIGVLAQDGNVYIETQDADIALDANDNISLAAATSIKAETTVAVVDRADANGIVLAAQDKVLMAAGSSLESSFKLGATTVDTVSNAVVLTATAFDGGSGVGGFNSTKFVNASTSISGKTSQAIVTQFGEPGEQGFVAAVSYADDVVEVFDIGDASDLILDNTKTASIPDVVAGSDFAATDALKTTAAGEAIAFVRSDFFDDIFLSGELELPTEIAIRRSSDFHLFEGGSDVNTKTLDVDGVFTGQGSAVPENNVIVERLAPPPPPEPMESIEITTQPNDFVEFDDPRPLVFNVIQVLITQIKGWPDLDGDELAFPSLEELDKLEELANDPETKIGGETTDKLQFVRGDDDELVQEKREGQTINQKLIEQWKQEYQDDFEKPRGAYIIQMEDRFRGTTTKAVFRAVPEGLDEDSSFIPDERLEILGEIASNVGENGPLINNATATGAPTIEPAVTPGVPTEADAQAESTGIRNPDTVSDTNPTLAAPAENEPLSSAVLPGAIGAGLWLQRRRQRVQFGAPQTPPPPAGQRLSRRKRRFAE